MVMAVKASASFMVGACTFRLNTPRSSASNVSTKVMNPTHMRIMAFPGASRLFLGHPGRPFILRESDRQSRTAARKWHLQ